MDCRPGVRNLTARDIPAAMELCKEAGWNQTRHDWQMLLHLHPDTCFGLDVGKELASTATLVTYGSTLGWIGMVLTGERFRRRGFARILVQQVVDVAKQKGVETLKLDATEAGKGLYTELGFREEGFVERWVRTSPNVKRANNMGQETAISKELDRQAFAADRTQLLEALKSRGQLSAINEAYALTRAGNVANYLGPCIAPNKDLAQVVIARAISTGGSWYWDLLPCNTAAVELALALGFTPARRLRRMAMRKTLLGQNSFVFALAGFEFG